VPSLTVVGPVFFEVFLPPDDVRARPGEERYVERIPVALGGSLNPASVAAALGADVTLLYPAGDGILDAAVAAAVARMGIRAVTWPSRPDPFLSLVHAFDGDRGFVSHGDMDALARCPAIPVADWAYVGGVKEAFAVPDRVAEVRAKGARVAVTGCWSPPDLARLASVRGRPWDLLVLNRREAEAAAGDADAAPGRLAGCAPDVVVTDGAAGAFGRVGGEDARSDGVAAEVVDLTGAGDAFAAAMVVAAMRGLAPADRLAFACRVASRVVGIHGGTVMDGGIFAGIGVRGQRSEV
jgi:sugar/nucleoside kinase (ribokinase family)